MNQMPVFYLCCYCGEKIKKSRANLTRHEAIHKDHKKVKCAASNCGQILYKQNYATHWATQHKSIPMPDTLNFIDVAGHRPKASKKKIGCI